MLTIITTLVLLALFIEAATPKAPPRKSKNPKQSSYDRTMQDLHNQHQRIVRQGFYESTGWKKLRWEAHRLFDSQGQFGCMRCGTESGEMHIDHIKPRSMYPELELDLNNLQRLCGNCNMEKSNKHSTDYRRQA